VSDYDSRNVFETLGAFVPGYKGYAAKEMRRETDRILRHAIVGQLQDRKRVLDDLMRDCASSRRLEHLESLESVRRRIEQVADSIRYAVQGYSGFFDTVQVKNEDLDRLYRYDLGLRERTERFTKDLLELRGTSDIPAGCAKLLASLQELSELARKRDSAITETA